MENLKINENDTSINDKIISDKIKESKYYATDFYNNEFRDENHYYPKVLNTTIDNVCSKFFNFNNDEILARFSRTNPLVDLNKLKSYLSYKPKFFKWAGCDLFKVIDQFGKKQMIVVETNSCPSGMKSTPLLNQNKKTNSYKLLIQSLYEDVISKIDRNLGDLAVIYDQNLMDSSGCCTTLADISNEKVWLVEYLESSKIVKWDDGIMFVCDKEKNWHSIRCCIRFVTQEPWKRIPLVSKTVIVNPIISCLAGGRNKILGSYAYKLFNEELSQNSTYLEIRQPYSLININKHEIPEILKNNSKLNKKAVIKIPYANCGQGVYTVINELELEKFMITQHNYDKFVVQSLVGEYKWGTGQYFHLGTLPIKSIDDVYAFDIRMIVSTNKEGFFPVSMNFRRARKPLLTNLDNCASSWELLGTNLSIKLNKDSWDTEEDRLLIIDDNDFNLLGLSIDDLIDAFIQTVLAVIAIDKLCISLFDEEKFNIELFRELNPDESFIREILLD